MWPEQPALSRKQSARKATLESAIERALDSGWLYDGRLPVEYFSVPGDGQWIYFSHEDTKYPDLSLNDLIYRHDFAEALWCEQQDCYLLDEHDRWFDQDGLAAEFIGKQWQFHLQNMVLADDPIAYLGDNL